MSVRPARFSLPEIFRWPLLIALATAIGLTSALLGDGGWDAVSWIALAIPLTIVARAIRTKPRPRH
jgi:hypothetical protein